MTDNRDAIFSQNKITRYMLTGILAGGLIVTPGDLLSATSSVEGTIVTIKPDADGESIAVRVADKLLVVNDVPIRTISADEITEIIVEAGSDGWANTIDLTQLEGLLLPAVQKVRCDLGDADDTYLGGGQSTFVVPEFSDSGVDDFDTLKFFGTEVDESIVTANDVISGNNIGYKVKGIELVEINMEAGSDTLNLFSENASIKYTKISWLEDEGDNDRMNIFGSDADEVYEFEGTTGLKFLGNKIEYEGLDRATIFDQGGSNTLSIMDTEEDDYFFFDSIDLFRQLFFSLNKIDFSYSGTVDDLRVQFDEGNDIAEFKWGIVFPDVCKIVDLKFDDFDQFILQGSSGADEFEISEGKYIKIGDESFEFSGIEIPKIDGIFGVDFVKITGDSLKQEYFISGEGDTTEVKFITENISLNFNKIDSFELQLGDGGDSATWQFQQAWPCKWYVPELSQDGSDSFLKFLGTDSPDIFKFSGVEEFNYSDTFLKIDGVKSASFSGFGGDDEFYIIPSHSTIFDINGGEDIGENDQLIFDALGGDPVFVKVRREAGTINLEGYQPVTYENIEQVEAINTIGDTPQQHGWSMR